MDLQMYDLDCNFASSHELKWLLFFKWDYNFEYEFHLLEVKILI